MQKLLKFWIDLEGKGTEIQNQEYIKPSLLREKCILLKSSQLRTITLTQLSLQLWKSSDKYFELIIQPTCPHIQDCFITRYFSPVLLVPSGSKNILTSFYGRIQDLKTTGVIFFKCTLWTDHRIWVGICRFNLFKFTRFGLIYSISFLLKNMKIISTKKYSQQKITPSLSIKQHFQ